MNSTLALNKRLIQLEEDAESSAGKGDFIDFDAQARRDRRQKKILNKIFDTEGMAGLERRHKQALARNRHRLPAWLAGHRNATRYSDFANQMKRSLDGMSRFMEFWSKRRKSLIGIVGDEYQPNRHHDAALKAAENRDLRAYQAAMALAYTTP